MCSNITYVKQYISPSRDEMLVDDSAAVKETVVSFYYSQPFSQVRMISSWFDVILLSNLGYEENI